VKPAQPKPSICRLVHYVVRSNGRHRPAIIVECTPGDPYMLNLHVFTDPTHDNVVPFQRNVMQDEEEKAPHTWHWPEREP
jgi:hypothetical protein